MRRSSALLIVAAILLSLPKLVAETNSAEALRLVPFPKNVERTAAGLKLLPALTLEVTDAAPAKQAAMDLQAELARQVGRTFKVSTSSAREGPCLLRLGSKRISLRALERAFGPLPDQPESYALIVTNTFAAVAAKQAAGLAHGIQTLRQLVRANLQAGELPGLIVHDWPSLQYRGFSDDITRGPSPTLATLQREVELSSLLRMNFFTYYLEHQFAFSKHPLIGPKDGSLRPEELKQLVAYSAARGTEIIGNQQSFGHFANILQYDCYAELRETPNVINPMSEKSYQLLDDLYSEQATVLPSKFFNVCCDETEGLGTGPSKPLAEKIGVGGVYTRHLRRIHDLLKDHYGKRMMMWGDIILNHPSNLADIPKDTVLLSWGYDPRDSFDSQITPFARSGYEFFVCPGVSCWSRILPDFQVSVKNIANFVRDGVRQHALGMLNTTWDDDGENLASPNWYGIAWGAECAWNGSTTPVAAFNRRVGAVLFGEAAATFGDAVELLGKTHQLGAFEGMPDNEFWKTDLRQWLKDEKTTQQAQELYDLVQGAKAKLEHVKKSAGVNADIIDGFELGAHRMELIATRILAGRLALDAYRKAATLSDPAEAAKLLERDCIARLQNLRENYADLKKTYVELWNRENRPYSLNNVVSRYDAAIAYSDGLLKGLNTALDNLKNGRALPEPQTTGLSAAADK